MRDEVIKLYETTELTLDEIGSKFGMSRCQVSWIINKEFSLEYRKERKSKCYRNSKLGEKNPMSGKTGDEHHNYKGDVPDGKGYIMCLKPEWYTGRQGCKHVFKHHIVMCEYLGITKIPAGFHVHHVDGNKKNNEIVNLALLTAQAHMRLHQLERATTRGNS